MLRFALALALLTAFSAGQWTQKSFILPDSFAGTGVYSVLCCPQSGRVFVGGEAMVVLDGASQERIARLPVRSDEMISSTISNKVYAGAYGLGFTMVVDAAALRVIDSIDVPLQRDRCYNPTMDRLYLCDPANRRLSVIDCVGDSLVAEIPLPDGPDAIACAPGENKVYCSLRRADTVAVIDCGGDSVIGYFAAGLSDYGRSMLHNHISNRLYIGDEDGRVAVVDCAADSVLRHLAFGDGAGEMCLNTRRNKVYVSGQYGSNMLVIDGAGDSVVGLCHVGDWQRLAVYDSVDDVAYVTLDESDSVMMVDCRTDTVSARVGLGLVAVGLDYDPAAGVVYAALDWGRLRALRGGSNEPVADYRLWCELSLPAWRTAGQELYGVRDESLLAVVDPELGGIVRELDAGEEIETVEYFAPSDRFYCSRRRAPDSSLLVVRCADGDSLVRIAGVPPRARALCFDPELERAWCGVVGDSVVYVVDARGDTLIDSLYTADDLSDIELAPDLDRVFIACRDGRLLAVVDRATGALIDTFSVGRPRQLLYVPGRQYLCVTEADAHRLLVLDAVSGATLLSHWISSSAPVVAVDLAVDKIYFAGSVNYVVVLDLARLTIGVVQGVGRTLWLALDTAEHRLFCGLREGMLAVVDTRTDSATMTMAVGYGAAGLWNPIRRSLLMTQPYLSGFTTLTDTTPIGVGEGRLTPNVSRGRPEPTIVRGVLRLRPSAYCLRQDVGLYDAGGRRVMALRAGVNDVSRLAPGIYFVRAASGVGRDASNVTKVVITR